MTIGMMKAFGIVALASGLLLSACSEAGDEKLKPYDNAGVPLDRGKSQCKAQAKAQAQGLAKGAIDNGVADDLYSDCLLRRGYFKE